MSESASNVKMFSWHDCGPANSRRGNNWATSDRGWCRLAWRFHPSNTDYMRYSEANCVGNYLDYGHDQNDKHDGPTIHCSAYIREQSGAVISSYSIGHTWVRTVDEAHRWIENQVSRHLAM